MIAIESSIALIDEILGQWRVQLGADYQGYRNHVYRMVHFCFALGDASEADKKKIAIAACFHDLGIWSDGTIDYLPPSVVQAQMYLERQGLAEWSQEIALMIDLHHKIRAVTDAHSPLIEIFRKADLVDVSLGLVKFGLPASLIRSVKAAFPNAGFHKRLLKLAGGWFSEHPLSAPPFLKW